MILSLSQFKCFYWFLSDYMCHVYLDADGLSGVAIADKDYPQRVAFNMLNKVCYLN